MLQHNLENTLVIYGCGGHARSLADVALFNHIQHLIFVDEQAQPNETLFNFPVLKQLTDTRHKNHIIGVGDNQKRARLYAALPADVIFTLIAKDAYVGINTTIDKGTFVGQGAHIGPYTQIGQNTIINTHSLVEHDCMIGHHSHISVKTVIAGRCQLDDFVIVGAGATVIDNIKICSHVTIGAGAVVTQDITEPGVYVGVPARKIKS